MDEHTNLSQDESGNGESSSLHYLTHIDPQVWAKDKPKRVEWLWDQIKDLDYASDDFTKGNPNVFIQLLFAPNSLHFEFGEQGYVSVLDIIPHLTANVHFALWDDPSVGTVIAAARELFGWLFNRLDLNRIAAMVPATNKQGVRLATLVGMKYEGTLRGALLKGKVYHDVHIYAILRREFAKQEVKH